ncbi:MAG: glycine dehydrogenase subunit 2 [Chloroflexota bacterium]|nr:glycine dehydrogenase subunit 2 [Chloroflexota bacterium]
MTDEPTAVAAPPGAEVSPAAQSANGAAGGVTGPELVRERELLLTELRGTAHGGPQLPAAGVPDRDLEELVPRTMRRQAALALPTTSEPEVLRHFGRLARRTFSLQQGLYPLGSCTMKYNPAVNEAIARLDGFAHVHPYQPVDTVQGALRLLWELERWLIEITGMDRISLQPAAGAHGEWTGLRIIQAYLRDQGQGARDTVLVPDSAHGTNPASASLAGLKSVTVKSTPNGLVDLDDYRAKLGPHVAAIMLTNPNTLGLFERDILEVARLAHEAGALLYYDGANLNALVGLARPGDMGFDVVHLNLHKTFSTPHGGGGPGAGPCGVKARLAAYLPVPTVEREEGADEFRLEWDRPGTIGKVRSFIGNFAVLVKAYAYMRAYGGEGLRQVALDAVLNANYLKARLGRTFEVASPEPSLHEFVLTTRRAKALGVTNIDLAKRLLDYGFYAPTVSFPLTVPEALMVEPTETESRETLDAFAEAMEQIWHEIETEPETVRQAPHRTPVGRLDEVRAARPQTMKLTWRD